MGKPASCALWGSYELCQHFGVDRSVLKYWRDHYPDFPKPKVSLKVGDVWDSDEMKRWHARTIARRS